MGKSREAIANALRLLKLPRQVKEDMVGGRLTMGHGRALLSLNSEKDIDALRKKIIRQTLSVRETEAQISRWKQQQGNSSKNTKVQKGIFVKKLEMELERKLGTKVEITPSKKGGKVLIRYYSDDDLERIRTLFI